MTILKEWIVSNKHKIASNELYYLIKNLFETEFVDENLILSSMVLKSLDICLDMRVNGLPLSKIFHKKWFYEDCFITTLDTLDPRPETEFLIEKIQGTPRSILELGVGTGCLLLSIIKKFYKSKGIGVDISSEALKIAKKNSVLLNLEKKVVFQYGNWANGMVGDFDLVISNPPYVDKNIKLSKETLHDPGLALFGSLDTYIDLKNSLKNIVFKQLLLEVPDYLLKDVMSLFKEYEIECYQIYNTDIYVLSIII